VDNNGTKLTLKPLLCPSAQPDMSNSMVLGVMDSTGDKPMLAYLDEPLPVTDDVLAMAGPVKPTEIFRFAAECEESACCHFDGTNCRLATRIVQLLPAVVETLPACTIRPTCRWFQQEGREVCFRCPEIVTQVYDESERTMLVATPA